MRSEWLSVKRVSHIVHEVMLSMLLSLSQYKPVSQPVSPTFTFLSYGFRRTVCSSHNIQKRAVHTVEKLCVNMEKFAKGIFKASCEYNKCSLLLEVVGLDMKESWSLCLQLFSLCLLSVQVKTSSRAP